jgi:hypothetical protein
VTHTHLHHATDPTVKIAAEQAKTTDHATTKSETDTAPEVASDLIESAPTAQRIPRQDGTEKSAVVGAKRTIIKTRAAKNGGGRDQDRRVQTQRQSHSSASKAPFLIKQTHSAKKRP